MSDTQDANWAELNYGIVTPASPPEENKANLWADFLFGLNPNVIYESAWNASIVVSVFATLGFIIAPGVRYIAESIRSLQSGKPFDVRGTLVAVTLSAVGYGLYSSLGWLVYEFVIEIHQSVNAFGHTATVTAAFQDFQEKIGSSDIGFKLSDIANSILASVMFATYNISNLLYLAVAKFLHFAHAFTFALLLVIGPVLISLSAWQGSNFLAGWAKMWAVVLLWPILEWVTMILVGQVFESALGGIDPQDYPDIGNLGFQIIVWASMTVMNIMAMAITIAIPLATNSLVSNSGSIASTVLPFSAAGMASGATLHKVGSEAAKRTWDIARDGAKVGARMMAANEELRDSNPMLNTALTGLGFPRPQSSMSQSQLSPIESSTKPADVQSTDTGAEASPKASAGSSSTSFPAETPSEQASEPLSEEGSLQEPSEVSPDKLSQDSTSTDLDGVNDAENYVKSPAEETSPVNPLISDDQTPSQLPTTPPQQPLSDVPTEIKSASSVGSVVSDSRAGSETNKEMDRNPARKIESE